MTSEEQSIAKYARRMPLRIRRYLNGRGITDEVIKRFRLGWNGRRITIPVYDREGHFACFRLARDPEVRASQPKMLSTAGSKVELYGWERVLAQPSEIVICEGEFDRLLLEAQGFAAVTSTGGAGTFCEDWAQLFEDIPYVYTVFDLDEAGRLGERNVARLIPHARIVRLPGQLGLGGDVGDFFVGLGRRADDFRNLLQRARPLEASELGTHRASKSSMRSVLSASDELAMVKSHTSLEWLAGHYTRLRRSGRNFIGRCPFHPDRTPSFVIFPDSRSYHCFGCKCSGDCISFLMRAEQLTFPEALTVLNRLAS